MSYRYAVRDGHMVNTAVLRQFDAMNAEFEKAFPAYSLRISDGVRKYSVQKAGYEAMLRGETGGVRWANPDSLQAYHVETNPTGPRALDIRDTGADAGVTKYGNARSAWIRDNAHRFGFDARGYREFNEPWHIESVWALDTDASPTYDNVRPFNPEGSEIMRRVGVGTVINVVPAYGKSDAQNSADGTLWIASSDGTFKAYGAPYDPNARGVMSKYQEGSAGDVDKIPTFNRRDFETISRFWRIAVTGR